MAPPTHAARATERLGNEERAEVSTPLLRIVQAPQASGSPVERSANRVVESIRDPAPSQAGQSVGGSTLALVFRNGRPRLQRSVRRNGKVTTVYQCSGTAALLGAYLDAHDRPVDAYDVALAREQQEEADELDRALDGLFDRARTCAEEALRAAGYHQHHRGAWRKRRGK